jgi:hypothetical protein
MAKASKPTQAQQEPAKKERARFIVNSQDQDITEIQKAIQEDCILEWPVIDQFFELPEGLVREMNHQSRQNYFVAKGLWEQAKKSPGKGYYGQFQVIELIPTNQQNRFKIEAPPDVHVFFPTLEQAKAAEYAGYKYISKKETRFRQVLPSPTPEGGDPDKIYIYNTQTGKPEHVAMYIPQEVYERHIQSIADLSHRNISRSTENLEEAKREAEIAARKEPGRYSSIEGKISVKDEPEELTQVYESPDRKG